MFKTILYVDLHNQHSHLPCTLKYNGVVAHFGLGNVKGSQQSRHSHSSSTYGTEHKYLSLRLILSLR